MELLPVEVIGNILSHLKSARDVVIASATCKKWREARQNHLHSLTFNSNDWPDPQELSMRTLEVIITQTILQTTGLRNLSILMDDDGDSFSASSVIAWLMYTRDTICRLHYNVITIPIINIIEKCGRQKLETLALANNPISGVEPTYRKFPCLKSLSLSYTTTTAIDLNLLLSACPKLEKLALINTEIMTSEEQATMELSSCSLKDIFVEGLSLHKLTLEADTLEILHLKDCALNIFELIGKGTLRVLKIDDFTGSQLDIGENTENLEIVDVGNFAIVWQKFYPMISKASMLKKLRLWGVSFDDSDEEAVDLDSISISFPKLSHLSLSYDLKHEVFNHNLQKSFQMKNVTILELGWSDISDFFSDWVTKLLERCPKLKKLIICGVVSETNTHEECQTLAQFTTSFIKLMRKYMHIEVQFDFE